MLYEVLIFWDLVDSQVSYFAFAYAIKRTCSRSADELILSIARKYMVIVLPGKLYVCGERCMLSRFIATIWVSYAGSRGQMEILSGTPGSPAFIFSPYFLLLGATIVAFSAIEAVGRLGEVLTTIVGNCRQCPLKSQGGC